MSKDGARRELVSRVRCPTQLDGRVQHGRLTMLTVAQEHIRQTIDKAVLYVWHAYGLSIERLGKLERVEYYAMLAVWDMFNAS